MKITKLLAVLLLSASGLFAAPPVIIGYVGGFKGLLDVSKINAHKLTHINYAFVNVIGNRAVLSNSTDSLNLLNLAALRRQNPALKIIISIGGWAWSENFSDAVLTDTSRQAFAASAVAIVRKYNLDGVDIDWEYPGMPGEDGNVYRPEDKQHFTLMFRDLRQELNKLQKESKRKQFLTTAVGGFVTFLDNTEMGKAAQYIDYVNLMTYDYGSHILAGHHTNLYDYNTDPRERSADKAVKAFAAAGVPMKKLVMGLAFYGHRYQLAVSATKGLGDSVVSRLRGSGYTFLKDSLVNQQGFHAFQDEKAQAPYLFNADTKEFISYEDEKSVGAKCAYVLKNKMGGVMFWEYGSDPKEYLLDEINKDL